MASVALRKESVDRNLISAPITTPTLVALRKESVDRNYKMAISNDFGQASLSARRAWIEISRRVHRGAHNRVALRKESVDRNKLKEVE